MIIVWRKRLIDTKQKKLAPSVKDTGGELFLGRSAKAYYAFIGELRLYRRTKAY